jgi:pimeloyl-ACP methyl ester carboxylesterase
VNTKIIIQTRCGTIEYRSAGQGPAVLVLHGGHMNCDSEFEHEQFFLRCGFRILIPSRPGYGATPSATGRSAEAFAEALIAMLDSLAIDQVVVFAFSAGGRTATQLASRHPERVRLLILECAVTSDQWPGKQLAATARIAFHPRMERVTWSLVRWMGHIAPTKTLTLMMGSFTTCRPATVIASMAPSDRQAVLHFIMGLRSGEGFMNDITHVCGDLGCIDAPTLIIHSEVDAGAPFVHALYAQRYIRHADLFITTALSHLVWYGPSLNEIEVRLAQFLHVASGISHPQLQKEHIHVN